MTPHLPAEIHAIISSYLAIEDLPAYRLSNKHLADIGAQHLFRDLSFHASHASLTRLKNLGNHSLLNRLVHRITWDTSSISLDTWDFNDWESRIRTLRRHELAELRESWHAQLIDSEFVEECMQRFLWKQYERYTKLVTEEREILDDHPADVTSLFASFPKLKTIVVERKVHDGPDGWPGPLETQATGLVQRGILQRHRKVSYRYSSDMFPLVAALRVAHSSVHQLEVRTLNFAVFGQGIYGEHLQHIDVWGITRLYLQFSLTDPGSETLESSMNIINCKRVLHRGHLKDFLRKFTSLQALGLDFEARSLGNGRAPVDLQDIFGEDQAWPQLRALTICHADTPASTITALLSSHAASLRSLSLGDVCLDPPGSWESLLSDIQPSLSLTNAEFYYFLFDARIGGFARGRSAMLGWYVDSQESVEMGMSDLGKRLEVFMIRGGICPLWEQQKVARVVGRLEDRRMDDWIRGSNSSVVT